eukprot:CAMPEP_0176130414 /NCGR_PEP_ID=MMETSP0120_2-20121206/65984_1 /TAXON_ID=160619 /ORGANISM="Kryptoperidinium foliaceum, Strain CCMP 1326" /LENGTH=111 /DNA_ID=CAMNT_0017465701 /DNA_START=110 /DNA_END=445 /DNA_ORIENTATION=+
MKTSLILSALLLGSANARRIPHMNPAETKSMGAYRFGSFGYPYGWGLDEPGMAAETQKQETDHTKVKQVSRKVVQSPKLTENTKDKIRRVSFFPLPHDHLDDIFLSNGCVE